MGSAGAAGGGCMLAWLLHRCTVPCCPAQCSWLLRSPYWPGCCSCCTIPLYCRPRVSCVWCCLGACWPARSGPLARMCTRSTLGWLCSWQALTPWSAATRQLKSVLRSSPTPHLSRQAGREPTARSVLAGLLARLCKLVCMQLRGPARLRTRWGCHQPATVLPSWQANPQLADQVAEVGQQLVQGCTLPALPAQPFPCCLLRMQQLYQSMVSGGFWCNAPRGMTQ